MKSITFNGESALTQPDTLQMNQIKGLALGTIHCIKAGVKNTDPDRQLRKSPAYLPKMIFEVYDSYMSYGTVMYSSLGVKEKVNALQ